MVMLPCQSGNCFFEFLKMRSWMLSPLLVLAYSIILLGLSISVHSNHLNNIIILGNALNTVWNVIYVGWLPAHFELNTWFAGPKLERNYSGSAAGHGGTIGGNEADTRSGRWSWGWKYWNRGSAVHLDESVSWRMRILWGEKTFFVPGCLVFRQKTGFLAFLSFVTMCLVELAGDSKDLLLRLKSAGRIWSVGENLEGGTVSMGSLLGQPDGVDGGL